MFGLGKYAQSWFYKVYLIYAHILVLWMKGYQLFRNCMSDATVIKLFGSGLTTIHIVPKRTVYMTYDIFFPFTDGCMIKYILLHFHIHNN